MHLTDLRVYNEAMTIGEKVWSIVARWDRLAQNTVGNQVIRSADSIAANISEGFGRFHYNDRLRFCYYARGSLYETTTWLSKAMKRKLISPNESDELGKLTNHLGIALNRYITSVKRVAATQEKTGAQRRNNQEHSDQ